MSSKFFEIIRGQKGLVYSIDADCTKIGENYLAEIFFATSNAKVKEALVAIKQILNDCANGQITQAELNKTKTKYISGFVFEGESNSNIASNNALDVIEYNRIISHKELVQEYMSVTLDEIVNAAKSVCKQTNYVVSAVGKCKTEDLKVY